MSDDWLTDVLHRVDARCAPPRDERDAPAGLFSALYWLAFWVVALGAPTALWHYGADVTGLLGALWQSLGAGVVG